jgi:hypothetical protein
MTFAGHRPIVDKGSLAPLIVLPLESMPGGSLSNRGSLAVLFLEQRT